MKPPIKIGQVIHFSYPEKEVHGRNMSERSRSVLVTEVRKQTKKPESSHNQSRWLIVGTCFDSWKRAEFHWELMRESRQTTWLTLGLYDPLDDDPEPFYRLGKFAPTNSQRELLRNVLSKYAATSEQRSDVIYCAGVFPWDETMPEPDRLRRRKKA